MAMQTIPNSGGRDRKGTISKMPVSTGDIIVKRSKITVTRPINADIHCAPYHQLVKELSVQQLLAYGILYLQTSSELPLY